MDLGRVGAKGTRYHGDVLIWLLGAPNDQHAPAMKPGARGRAGRLGLAAQSERGDELLVAIVVGPREVRQEAAATADHLE